MYAGSFFQASVNSVCVELFAQVVPTSEILHSRDLHHVSQTFGGKGLTCQDQAMQRLWYDSHLWSDESSAVRRMSRLSMPKCIATFHSIQA